MWNREVCNDDDFRNFQITPIAQKSHPTGLPPPYLLGPTSSHQVSKSSQIFINPVTKTELGNRDINVVHVLGELRI